MQFNLDNQLGSFDDKVKLRFLLNEFKTLVHILRWCDHVEVTFLRKMFFQSRWLMIFKRNISQQAYRRWIHQVCWYHNPILVIPTLGYFECIICYACSVSASLWQFFFLLFDIYHCLQLSAFLRKWSTWREDIFVNYNSKIWDSLECNFCVAFFRINFAEYYLDFIS